MAEVKFQKNSPEWLMFQDYYKICQKYWLPENTDNYWQELIAEVSAFTTKYKDIELAKHIMAATYEAMEEKLKKI